MSIKYLSREELDDVKYNNCITESKQALLYGYTWYLDIVCDRWDVLVLDDYVAVMPVPWRKKYGIKFRIGDFFSWIKGTYHKRQIIRFSINQ